MKYLLLLFIPGILFSACSREQGLQDNFAKDSTISTASGEPKDSLAYYLPTTIRKDTQIVKLDIDNHSLNQFSNGLYYAKEPILFNYYLGHDIYRFSLLRDFKIPIYFILHKDGTKVWLTTKALDRSPNLAPPSMKFVGDWKTGSWVQVMKDEYGDTIIKNSKGAYTRRANVVYNTTIQLTQKDWMEFEILLKECDYWNMEPFDTEDKLDSERWLIEAHLMNKYWFVHVYSPKGGFQKAGNFLIQRSGIMNEPIFTQK